MGRRSSGDPAAAGEAPVASETGHRAALWVGVTGAAQAWKFAVTIASSVILSRLLAPKDFGLVATVGPIVALADLLRDLGFTQAVVQRPVITKAEMSALFWISLGLTVTIATVLTAISPLVAAFFHEPRLALILTVAAWTLVLGTLSALPNAWLNRELRFFGLAAIDCLGSGVGMVLAVGCALLTHSYWALMVSGIGYGLTAAILSQRLSRWSPGTPDFGGPLKEMMKFGAGVSIANIAIFFGRNADNLLIARVYGPVPLGLYDRAYKLMLMPLSQVTWPLTRVFTPLLTRQFETPRTYCDTYFKASGLLALAVQPVLIVAVVFSGHFVEVVLGQRWVDAAPIFGWLGIAAIQQIVSSSLGWLFLSQGRSRDYALASISGSVIAVTAFVIGLKDGPVGVARAYAISEIVLRGPVTLGLLSRRGPIRLPQMLKTLVAPHLSAVLGSALALAVVQKLLRVSPIFELTLGTATAYAAYIIILALWPEKRLLLVETFVWARGKLRQLKWRVR